MTNLTEGNYESIVAKFAPRLKEKLDELKLAKIWTSIESRHGEMVSISRRSETTIGDSLFRVDSYCLFEYGTQIVVSITLRKTDHTIVGLYFRLAEVYEAPSYADRNAFFEKEVAIKNDGAIIFGSLTWPKHTAAVVLLVMIPGSGPLDRNVTVGPNQPFKDLAYGLSSNGIACYRFDKTTYTNPNFHPLTFDDDYGITLTKILEHFSEVDSISSIYLLGHSLGATLSLIISQKSPVVRGQVLMAGSARQIDDLLLTQIEYLRQLAENEEEKQSLMKVKVAAKKLKSGKVERDELVLGARGSYWQSLKNIDVREKLRSSQIPTLLLHGDRDYQASIEDFKLLQEECAVNTKLKFIHYDSLNHLFFRGAGRSKPQEYFSKSNVDSQVINDIINWLSSTSIR